MNEENNLPSRIFEVRLLNVDLQKDGEDRFLAKEVRIGPSGALEYTRIFTDSNETYKGFYQGDFHATEMSFEDFEHLKRDHDEHHHHREDEDENE